jgi:hypothetical protein
VRKDGGVEIMRLAIGLVLAGLLVVGTSPSSAAADQAMGASSPASSDVIRFRAEHGFDANPDFVAELLRADSWTKYGPGLTAAEVEDLDGRADLRARLDLAIGYVNQQSRQFGGAFFDQSAGELKLVVRVVAATTDADLGELETLLPSDAIVEFRRARYSMKYLEDLRDELFLSLPVDESTYAYVDPVENQVVLGAPDDVLDVAAVRIGSRSDAVSFTIGRRIIGDACSSRTACTSPWRGGTYLSGCTWSFNVRPTASSSTRYVLSAGHCSHLGDDRLHNGAVVNQNIGVDRNSFDLAGTVNADAMRAPLKSFSGSANLIYDSDFTKSHAITSFELTANQTVGETIAMSGITGGYVFGTINAVNLLRPITRGTDTKQVYLMRATFNSGSGDSGAPVYWGPKAYGIDHGHSDGDNRALFSTIGRANTDMNTRLCLNASCT